MRTILVPTQHIATMKSALETAVLLARRTGAYIEGFPLRTVIPPYVVAELTAGLSMDAYDTQRDEETGELRRLFEGFMQAQGIPPSGTGAQHPCFGWLATAPEDEGFVGSHGRSFDVAVINRLDAGSTGLQRRVIETALFERAGRFCWRHRWPRSRSPATSWSTGTAVPSRRAPTPLRCRCCNWPTRSRY